MASFGDNSTVFQRRASLGTGLSVETGDWTSGSTASICIPTTFTRVISYVSESGDGSCSVTTPVEISNSNLVATTNETTSGKVIKYIAFGW